MSEPRAQYTNSRPIYALPNIPMILPESFQAAHGEPATSHGSQNYRIACFRRWTPFSIPVREYRRHFMCLWTTTWLCALCSIGYGIIHIPNVSLTQLVLPFKLSGEEADTAQDPANRRHLRSSDPSSGHAHGGSIRYTCPWMYISYLLRNKTLLPPTCLCANALSFSLALDLQ